METQREVGLDIIRSTAIFSVVSIHLFLNTDFYLRVYSGFDLGIQVFFHSLFMVCVPLFMMLTGYLLKNKVMSQDFYKKGISICCFYLIYVCLVLLYKVIAYKETFSIRDIFDSILSFSGRNYFWYIKFYLILYMFIPLLNWLYPAAYYFIGCYISEYRPIVKKTCAKPVSSVGFTRKRNENISVFWKRTAACVR